MALHLGVKARTGHRPDNRLQWKRPRGRPRHPWMQQLEVDTGLAADVAWDSQWSSSMEGTMTHRRSSGLMNEWMNRFVHEL